MDGMQTTVCLSWHKVEYNKLNSPKHPVLLLDTSSASLLIGWWWGNRVVLQDFCAGRIILCLGGAPWFLQKNSRVSHVYSLRRNQDSVPRLYYCFLTAPPLFLHSLPSLMSNWLNLPFGTQGRSRRLDEAYFRQTRKRAGDRHRKDWYPGGFHRTLLGFQWNLTWVSCWETLKAKGAEGSREWDG